jgi:hypothetical protein
MGPLAIASFVLSSCSIVLKMGIAIYKFIKQDKYSEEKYNHQNHIFHGHGVLHLEEHKEQKLPTTSKKKSNHHTDSSEETELSHVEEHTQNNSINASGDQEELTSE